MKLRNVLVLSLVVILILLVILLFIRNSLEKEHYLVLLRNCNYSQKSIALENLQESHFIKDGFELALKALKIENSEIRLKAISYLISINPLINKNKKLAVSKEIIPLLNDENERVAADAASYLGLIGCPDSVEPLVDALTRKEKIIRYFALYSLSKFTTKKYLSEIKKAYEVENDEITKWMAAVALGNIGDRSGYEILKSFLTEKNDFYRILSGCALIKIGESWPIPIVLSLVEKEDSDPIFQERVIDTLRMVTGKNFNFDYNLSDEKRVETINKWIDWWGKNKDRLVWNQDKEIFETVKGARGQIFPPDN